MWILANTAPEVNKVVSWAGFAWLWRAVLKRVQGPVPLIGRELRVNARKKWTYWIRFVLALLALAMCLPILTVGVEADQSYIGRFSFNCLLTVAFLLSCICCLLTADSISLERREDTLSLLLLTPVRAFDVLLGKLGAVGLGAACGLAAFLPLLMLPLLVGGVSAGEAVRSALVLLETLFLALAVGLWASAGSVHALRSALRALGLLAVIILVPAAVEGVARGTGALFTTGFGLVSPLVALFDLDPQTRAESLRYFGSLGAVQLYAWYLLVRAHFRMRAAVRPSFSDERADSEEAPERVQKRRARESFGSEDPIRGLVLRQRGLRAMCWTAGLVGIGFTFFQGLVCMINGYPPRGYVAYALWPVSCVVYVLIEGLMGLAASRFFYEAQRSGQLEVLMATPVGARTILSAQWRALVRILCWPLGLNYLLSIFLQLVMLSSAFRDSADIKQYWRTEAPVLVLLGVLNAVGWVCATCWLGMLYGLRGQSPLAIISKIGGLSTGIPVVFQVVTGFAMIPLYRFFGTDRLAWLQVDYCERVIVLTYCGWLIWRTRKQVWRVLRAEAGEKSGKAAEVRPLKAA